MFTVPLCIIIFAVLGLCLLIVFKLKKKLTAALFVKTGISILFILLGAWGATRPIVQDAGLDIFVFCVMGGLTLGLLGDIWLDLKDCHANQKRIYMLAGFCSFGLGHLLYCAGLFFVLGKSDVSLLLWPVIISIVLVIIMALIEKPLHMDYGEYRLVVMVYTFVLTFATVLPLEMWLRGNTPQTMLLCFFAIGMVLFLLSDLVLSQSYFSKRAMPAAVFVPLNYLFYYGGQFTIAASLLLIQAV